MSSYLKRLLNRETTEYVKTRLREGWNEKEVTNELLSWYEYHPTVCSLYVAQAANELTQEEGKGVDHEQT